MDNEEFWEAFDKTILPKYSINDDAKKKILKALKKGFNYYKKNNWKAIENLFEKIRRKWSEEDKEKFLFCIRYFYLSIEGKMIDGELDDLNPENGLKKGVDDHKSL